MRVSVAPANGEYSPPEREVGMLMTGMVHGLGFRGLLSTVSLERSSIVKASFASACARSLVLFRVGVELATYEGYDFSSVCEGSSS